MSETSVPPRTPTPREYLDRGGPRGDPAWLRPTALLLLGLLVGTLVIASTKPLSSGGWHPSNTNGAAANASCDHVVVDSQHLTDLATRAADAAQHQDATSLTTLVDECMYPRQPGGRCDRIHR